MIKITENLQKHIDETIMVDCCIVRPTTYWSVGVKGMGEGFDPWSMCTHTQIEGKMIFADNKGDVWYYGLMMTAGSSLAARFNGESWKIVYGASLLDEEMEKHLAGKVILKAADLMDKINDL